MKVAVTDLPDDPRAFDDAWVRLQRSLADAPVDLLVLPELAGLGSFWVSPGFDAAVWRDVLARQRELLERLPQLAAQRIVGTLAEAHDERRLNRAFVHTAARGLERGRAKAWLPEQEGGWEATWFDRGDPQVPVLQDGDLRFATLICTEVIVSGAAKQLGRDGVQLIAVPRATGGHARWRVSTRMAALSAGAYVLSANRSGGEFAGGSTIVGPDAEELARSTPDQPLAVLDIDLTAADHAKSTYPRNVLEPDPA